LDQTMMSILWILGLIAILYFLMIRPQQQRQKKQTEMIESLRVGDKMITVGGVHGKVAAIKDDSLMIEIAANVQIELQKVAVGQKISEDEEE